MRRFAQLFFHYALGWPVHLIYRMRRTGTEHLPRDGGVLLLSNHVSYIDSFIVYMCCPRRPVRFVVLEKYTQMKAIGWFLNLFDPIPINPKRARQAIDRTVEALRNGDVVCLFPEGGLTRMGVIQEFKKGFELIVKRAECPVVPVYMDGLWESIFSFERGRYFKKWPHGFTCPLQVSFGRPIPPGEATVDRVREAVMEQSVEAFALRREFDAPLEKALVRSLKRRRRRPLFVEHGRDGARQWSRAAVLGLTVAIARRWMNQAPEPDERIGILLPPGPTTAAIQMGLFLAGKTPVNLPFTIDQRETEALAVGIAPLGIRTVITSRAFMPHLADFWQGDEGVFIDMKSVLATSGSVMALGERIRAFLEPAWVTCWRLDLDRRPRDREAVGLVGAPGETPLLLSSLDLFRNARQVTAADFARPDDVVFSEEPLSTPGGLTLGCWSAVLGRGAVVGRSFSLREEAELLERALAEQGVDLVVGSNRFFAALDRPLAVDSVRYGIVFGPAGPGEIEDREKKLGIPLARAWSWGGRVVTMSRTDPEGPGVAGHLPQSGRTPRSVGRVLPGIAARLEEGRLLLRFSPADGDDEAEEWASGPDGVEMDDVGFVYLQDAALGSDGA